MKDWFRQLAIRKRPRKDEVEVDKDQKVLRKIEREKVTRLRYKEAY